MLYELDFKSPDGRTFIFEISVPSNDKENIKNEIRPILYRNYLEFLLRDYRYEELYEFYTSGNEVSKSELARIIWNIDRPNYQCIGVSKK